MEKLSKKAMASVLRKVYLAMSDTEERNVQITSQAISGVSRENIAATFGMTAERVRQIVEKETDAFVQKLKDENLKWLTMQKINKDAEVNRILSYIGIGRSLNEADKWFASTVSKFSPIGSMGFSMRLSNVFRAMGINKVGDIFLYTIEDFRSQKNFGKKCEYELFKFLGDNGFSLHGEQETMMQRGKADADCFMVCDEGIRTAVEDIVVGLQKYGKERRAALKLAYSRLGDYIETEIKKL